MEGSSDIKPFQASVTKQLHRHVLCVILNGCDIVEWEWPLGQSLWPSGLGRALVINDWLYLFNYTVW